MYHRKRYLIVLAIALVLVMQGLGISQAGPPGPPHAAPIKLKAATFTPGRDEAPPIAPGLAIAGYAQGQTGTYIVQFQGPVEQAWKDQVVAQGAELLDYIPDFAFKARMTPAQAARVEGLESVSWVGLYHPAYKLSPDLVRDGTHLYRVKVERGASAGLVRAAVARSGAQVMRLDGGIMLVAADAAQLEDIARVADVAWVENYVLPEKHNDSAAGVILGSGIANGSGYDGSSQIVAVADTGLGDGTAAGAHPDIPASRIKAIYNWPGVEDGCFTTILDDGPQDVDSGHGTHTSGSVLSDGGDSGEGKGTAPAASLVFQATENYVSGLGRYCRRLYDPGYYLTGLPADLHDLYQQAYNVGARIHSNSWGNSQAGVYTTDSANTDDFVWDNPDMAITFSTGNQGTDSNADGIVDPDSVGSPATAKNVISVGASENDRQGDYACDTGLTYESHDAYQPGVTCSDMGGDNWLGTYGQRYPDDFPAEPLFSDTTAGNAGQMASWSSRGPVDDGRIKPDVVAPGTWIMSAFSGLYQEGYGDPVNPQNDLYQWDGWGMPRSEVYKYMGGTSMANPLVAGAAAVVRDYYEEAHTHAASAALVKATLINSAVDMLDENNDGEDDNDYPIPNYHEGWGRVNLADATDDTHQWVDEAAGLNTGGTAEYVFEVGAGGAPFKVSLVWSDYPSTESAAQNLVNDLDLVVTAPDGTTVYRGNNFSGGWTLPGGSADRVNNVENVYVAAAAAGTWTVEVVGYNVPNGPQPYALVVDGVFGEVDAPPSVSIVAPAEGSTVEGTVTVQVDADDAEDPAGSLTVEWNVDGGAWQSAGYNAGTGCYEASWDSTGVVDGDHTINARATDSAANESTDSNTVNVDNVNDPPVASFSFSCIGLTCDFDASGSYDPDGSIVGYDWDSGDDGSGSGVNPSHTYAGEGTYTVILTVTDDDDATDTESQDVEVSEGATTMHVGDLDGSSARVNRRFWRATVVITVHDAGCNPVEGAEVTGTWNGGNADSCTTGADGQCSIDSPKISAGSVDFAVSGVTHATLTYASTDNHDPDGDSDGTIITIQEP